MTTLLPFSIDARRAWIVAPCLLASFASAQRATTNEIKHPRPLPHMQDIKTPAPTLSQPQASSGPRATQQGSANLPPKHESDARPARPIDFSRVYFDAPGDGSIWAHGATYKASADGARFTYIPFFGSKAPRNFPVSFELESIAVGGQQLGLAAAGAVSRSDDRLLVDRGATTELYDLDPNGAKQEFVFETLPRTGDLALRMRVTSELEARTNENGIEFANDLGFVRYGKALALDAGGRRLEIESVWNDGAIELRVPAAFLAGARLPLTIDPVISTFTVDNSVSDESSPDIAYEASTATYSVCWERIFSATDHDIWIQSQDASGVAIGGTLDTIDFTSLWWAHPRIATNTLASQFLVVAAVGNPSSTPRTIWGREREAESPYTLGAQFQISDPAITSDQLDPDVGGDPVLAGPTYYCVVWTRVFNTTDRDVFARLVTSSSTLLGTSTIFIDNSGATVDINPSVSKSDGPAPFGLQDWNIAWQRNPTTGNSDIHAAQIHWDGVVTTPSFAVPLFSVPLTFPSPTPGLDIGGQRYYLIAFEANYGDRDIAYGILNGSSVVDLGGVNFLENDNLLFQDQVRPAAETDGSCFAVAYSEQYLTSTTDYDVWISSLYYNGASTVLAEGHSNLAFSGSYEIDAQMTSCRSGGASGSHDYGAVWMDTNFTQGDIEGGIYRCATGGPVTSFCYGDGSAGSACPCSAGIAGAGCPNSIFSSGASLFASGDASVSQDSLVLHGVSMPNATAVYFQGTTSVFGFVIDDGIMCVGGTITRLGSKLNAGNQSQYPVGSEQPISIRGAIPASAGVTRAYQCFYRNAATFCTPATSNRTNALSVTWLP